MKWWRMKEDNLKIQFREKVLSERRLLESVQEWVMVGRIREKQIMFI